MTLDYIITGLPRTRKAWLANLLTFGKHFCAFEAFREGPDHIDNFLPDNDKYDLLGDADTSASLYQDRILSDHPNIQWILIDREHQDVSRSVKNLGFKVDQNLHDLSVKLSELRMKFNPLVIKFEELDDRLPDIFSFLGISDIPKDRIRMLQELNVSVNEPKISYISTPVEPPAFTPKGKEYMDLLWSICAPNEVAYRWLIQVIEVALVWDHVIDKDAIDFTMTDRAFKALLLEWALNDFWLTNSKSLLPVLSSAISSWQSSYLDGMSKDKAYSIYEDVPSAVAFILGGQGRVDKFMPRLRYLVHELRIEDDNRDGGRL